MAHRDFKKEDFEKGYHDQFWVEYKKGEIGEGVNLVVEKKTDGGEYEVIQAEIMRKDNSVFISWDQPFDGRIIFED